MNQTNLNTVGTLYVVATPIGNLEDITLRALRILKEVDLIAAEDTRHTKQLLNHFDIHTPLISYYREKEAERSEELVQKLLAGDTIALVSDAGTPGISDPGAVLVKKAREAGITIVPLPGPSALTAALSAAGLTDGTFLFLGFPPARKGQRQKLLSTFVEAPWALVFYESPHRIDALLADVLAILGDRQAFWARELSKLYEDLQAGSISQLLDLATGKKNRGEFVLIIQPGSIRQQATGENVEEILLWYKENTELSLKDVSRRIAKDLGLSRSDVYQKALEVWAETKEES
jgi:16S rRNA (cytidine1402-2'-O)-methyltransferase